MRKKKVLLVSYFYPPNPAVGSLRSAYLSRYLPAEGWEVKVISPKMQESSAPPGAVLETDYTDVVAEAKRKIGLGRTQSAYAAFGASVPKIGDGAPMTLRQRLVLNAWRVITFPDAMRGWYRPLIRAVRQQIATGEYQAVISTSPPVTAHIAVAKAAGGVVPWIADLRDLWAGNPYHPGRVRYALDRFLEIRALSNAAAITSVSQRLVDMLRARFPSKPIFSILNAFDPSEWSDIPFVPPSKCTLTYAGQMRDPSVLFRALQLELEASALSPENFELNLYTAQASWLDIEIEKYALRQIVRVKGFIERKEVLRVERGSTANVIISSFRKGEEAGYTAKLFEYLGARRPIIAIGPSGSVIEELLHEVGSCWYGSNVEEVRKALRGVLRIWEGKKDAPIPLLRIEQFSAEHLASRFARILDQVTSSEPTGGRQ